MRSHNTVALVRLSAELSTKARGTRRRFLKKLVENVRNALATTQARFEVESQWTRLYIRTEAAPEQLEVLKRVAGISSYSLVLAHCSSDLDEIVRTGIELFGDRVKGRTFAVRGRRSGTHPYSSGDLQTALGSALNPGAKVDLSNPEVEVEVEVRDAEAYFYSGKEDGLGGLPLGVEGRAVCLLSGGFDSAAAAWMMLKRGVQLDYVFCNLAGDAYERSVLQVAKVLADDWSYGTSPRLFVVDFNDVVDELRARSHPKFWQLVLKRLMYRTAERITDELHAHAIVTGESIGQVSSQTLANLSAIDGATRLPVFRPLIGFDKMDIIELTRRIGTAEISSKVKEYCAIAPGNPATRANPRETEEQEAQIDLTVLDKALEGTRILKLRTLQMADLVVGYLFTETVPDDAVVVDLREENDWDEWHYPGSVHQPSWELSANPRALAKDRKYVLYCDRGVQSAQIAEKMQREGYEAYAYRGGTAALRKRAADSK